MDYIVAYILTNHRELMEFILERFDIKYVKNTTEGVSLYNQYQFGEIIFNEGERNLTFIENYWVNGKKVEGEDVMTFVRIGDFGIGQDIIKTLIDHFGGCAKNQKGLIFCMNDIDKASAKSLLKGKE